MKKLSTQLTLSIIVIILVIVSLISLVSNLMLNRQFERYISVQQKERASEITESLSLYYNSFTRIWNLDSIHALGMHSLNEGYILSVYDNRDNKIWDAESHEMTLCLKVMEEISARMEQHGAEGAFTAYEYSIEQNGQKIGTAKISYYSPFFLSENDFSFLGSLNAIFIAVGLISILASLFIGELLARRITRPIVKTSDIAMQIAAGNYDIQFEGETKTRELRNLMLTINHLASALSRQEKFRKQLSADIAHELRTPLATLGTHLEAMTMQIWEPTPERLKSLHEEILRLSTIVADLERIERVEGENLMLNKAPVDLFELVRTVCVSFEGELRKKDLKFTLDGGASVINIDKDKISGVISNIMSNAVKYTPEHGEIRAYVQDSENNSIFIMEDTGIGIPQDELPHIFERFYRADKSRNRNTGGTGLGLAIVKAIVTAHGGTVDVQSGLNPGSRFIVTLPKHVS
ncbi:MAG TPA: HAMP domain-containing sensor histidine kinase [Anaerovoracaceae bacterium]|nr:HAMP domain-containing sensor histidine kinase [Anaerovoracaceae bacterium]